MRLERRAGDRLRQLDDAPGVLDHLHRLDAGEFVEEPAATRVHQHRVALHFEQLPEPHALRLGQFPHRMVGQEARDALVRAVEDDADIVVARRPRVMHERPHRRLIDGRDGVAQPVEGGAQGAAPFLVPIGAAAGIAAAVAPPALDAVLARPRGVLDDLHFMSWREELQKLAVVRQVGEAVRLDMVERVGERHVAVARDGGRRSRRRWRCGPVAASRVRRRTRRAGGSPDSRPGPAAPRRRRRARSGRRRRRARCSGRRGARCT